MNGPYGFPLGVLAALTTYFEETAHPKETNHE